MILLNFLIIFLLIGFNAFFVAVEFAAVSSRRSRLDMLTKEDGKAANLVRRWLEHPKARDRLIAASQLGITVVSLALGAVGENTFEALLNPLFNGKHFPGWLQIIDFILPALPIIFSLIIVTSLHVVLGEQVPKVAVLRAPEKFALLSAPIMDFYSKIFKGFIDILDWATRQILSLLGIPANFSNVLITSEELKQIVSGPEVEGMLEEPEREMLSAVIDFGDLVARQIMIPRMEIVALDAAAPLSAGIDRVLENSITKIPVYEDDLDNITGILHLRDLIKAQRNKLDPSTPVGSLKREALFVPESISVNDLLHQFKATQSHLAIVMDEFGGTLGLVTLEDVLEEIVGDVRDAFESEPPSIVTSADGTIIIDGLTMLEDVNEHFGINLQDPHYDTIAGFILGKLGRLARPGDVVELKEEKILLKVEQMNRMRIDQVLLQHIAYGQETAEKS